MDERFLVTGQIVKCFLPPQSQDRGKNIPKPSSSGQRSRAARFIGQKKSGTFLLRSNGDLLRRPKLLKSSLIAGPMYEFPRFSCLPYIR